MTERPETTECGNNILAGAIPKLLESCMKSALKIPGGWLAPEEYQWRNVATTVAKIMLSYRQQ